MRLDSPKPGPLTASLTLHSGADAPGDARSFIRQRVSIGDQQDAAALLVSELVTNAVCYANGNVELTVCEGGGQIRVEVSDSSPVLPRIREPGLESGRGLHLVEALAESWGVDGRCDGKTVWFEVPSVHRPDCGRDGPTQGCGRGS